MNCVLVIVVTYNAMKWIDKCLGGIYRSSIPADIFIVDNNSSDETVNHIKKNHQYLKLIESKNNLGFGKANNLGLEFAVKHNYEYVYLLNQDAWVFESTFRDLINIHQRNSEYGVLSPMHMYAGGNKLDSNFLECCPKEIVSDLYFNSIKKVYPTNFVMAAHWLITRQCLRKVGGFSHSFPHYGEDHNYIHRVNYFGFKIGIVPGAKSVHDRELRQENKELTIRKMYLGSVVAVSNPNKNLFVSALLQPALLLAGSIKLRSVVGLQNSLKLILNYPIFIRNRNRSKTYSFLN